jgi:hypothetical protein
MNTFRYLKISVKSQWECLMIFSLPSERRKYHNSEWEAKYLVQEIINSETLTLFKYFKH